MRRLSYSKAEAYVECAKKGDAMHRRLLPPPLAAQVTRIFKGHVVDLVIAKLFEEGWWKNPATAPDRIGTAIDMAITWVRRELVPGPLVQTPQEITGQLTPLLTAVDQMQAYGLLPEIDYRTQALLEVPVTVDGVDLMMTGGLDLVIENSHGAALLDVKAGTYHKPMQLSWYRKLMSHYNVRPSRVGFWFPLKATVQWHDQSKLPQLDPFLREAARRISVGAVQPEPGVCCTLCPLNTTCEQGVRYLHTNASLASHIDLSSGLTHTRF